MSISFPTIELLMRENVEGIDNLINAELSAFWDELVNDYDRQIDDADTEINEIRLYLNCLAADVRNGIYRYEDLYVRPVTPNGGAA